MFTKAPVPREIPNCLRSWEILCRKWVVLTWRKVSEGVGVSWGGRRGGWDQLGPSEAAGGSARAAGNDESVSSSLISNDFTWEGVIKMWQHCRIDVSLRPLFAISKSHACFAAIPLWSRRAKNQKINQSQQNSRWISYQLSKVDLFEFLIASNLKQNWPEHFSATAGALPVEGSTTHPPDPTKHHLEHFQQQCCVQNYASQALIYDCYHTSIDQTILCYVCHFMAAVEPRANWPGQKKLWPRLLLPFP